jgi:hypothetical protein
VRRRSIANFRQGEDFMTSRSPASLSLEHLDFYARFVSFWGNPSGSRVPELIAPDATIHFTGLSTFSGC